MHGQNLKNILFFSTLQIIFGVGRLNIKIILEIKFYFNSTFRKITVGGFVNQPIKNSGLNNKQFSLEFVHLVF